MLVRGSVIALILCFGGCTILDPHSEMVVPVTAVLDPTSRLYQLEQIVVIGYLRCFGELTRLYSTYDEAKRASLINSITVVKNETALDCPGGNETELAYCSYRGSMSLPDRYSAPQLNVDEFLQCSDLGPSDS